MIAKAAAMPGQTHLSAVSRRDYCHFYSHKEIKENTPIIHSSLRDSKPMVYKPQLTGKRSTISFLEYTLN